jgi:hypothetical protein
MTKTSYLTNLKEVNTIRVKCNHCLAVAELPIYEKSVILKQCINCNKSFHGTYIEAFGHLREAFSCLGAMKKTENKDLEVELLTD